MQYSRKMTRNRANGLLIFAWCLGLVCALPPCFGWSTYVYRHIFYLPCCCFYSRLWLPFSNNEYPIDTFIKSKDRTLEESWSVGLAFNWCWLSTVYFLFCWCKKVVAATHTTVNNSTDFFVVVTGVGANIGRSILPNQQQLMEVIRILTFLRKGGCDLHSNKIQ